MRHTFWLGERPVETDPRMRRIAECIADIRPAIERLSRTYGDRGIVWALAAIIVHMAVEAEDEQAVAAILRTNARLLDVETGPTCRRKSHVRRNERIRLRFAALLRPRAGARR